MRLILETGWACRITEQHALYWLRTANGATNRRQIKVYSTPARARAAANYPYRLPLNGVVEVFLVEVSVEIPDDAAPF